MVRSWIVPYIGDMPLQRLRPRDLDRLYAELRARPLKGKSVRNAHVTLHKALADAVQRGHVPTNFADAVDPPAKDDSAQRSAWSVGEVRTFLAIAASDRLGAAWRLALASGMRRGELCGLNWSDVEGDRIAVHRQVRAAGADVGRGRGYVRETTKSRRIRTVLVDEHTGAELRRWKARQAEERLAFGPAYADEVGSSPRTMGRSFGPTRCRPGGSASSARPVFRRSGSTALGPPTQRSRSPPAPA